MKDQNDNATQDALDKLADEDIAATAHLDEGVTPEPEIGPAIGIQLFLTENNNGIIRMHDANEMPCAEVQMTIDQLQQMRDALESMVNHLIEVENAQETIQ